MTSSQRSILAIVLTAVFVSAAGATAALLFLRPAPPASLPELDPSPDGTGLPVLFQAPAFALTNDDGRPISSDALKGHPYVAAFIFTNCTSTCPAMSGRMSTLQEEIADKEVRLVSFTVDPVRDTPDVLKAYAAKFHADAERWFLLTGAAADMAKVESGFHVRLPHAEPSDNAGPAHSDRFLLVDGSGNVRAVYDSKDAPAMASLKRDAARLAALAGK